MSVSLIKKVSCALLLGFLLPTLAGCQPATLQTPDSSSPVATAVATATPSNASVSPSEIVTPSAPTPSANATDSASSEATPVPADYETFSGRVEHIFFHPLVYNPKRAFSTKRYNYRDMDDWFVTVSEYKKMLQSIYEKNFILVHYSDVYEEKEVKGHKRMVRKKLMLPPGKKPLVISYDDVSYYDYMRDSGVVWKLVLGEDGEIWDYSKDSKGGKHVTQERDIVTLLDAFVKEHPDFSLNGAKGTIALTGFQGILGYRTQKGSKNRASERAAVAPIIEKLKATGWDFASHSYGHINQETASLERFKSDVNRWEKEVKSLLGHTNFYIYPFGSSPEGNAAKMAYLRRKGFRIFAAVGVESYSAIDKKHSAVYMDRRHPDGTTLRNHRSQYLDLYDAKEVFDPLRTKKIPVDFKK